MRNFLKVPEHWLSTEEQTKRYLQSTAQAKMFDARKQATRNTHQSELIPEQPVEDYEASDQRRHSLRKKIGAGILSVATLVAPSGQYATSLYDRPVEHDAISLSEIVSETVIVTPETNDTKSLIISGAYNDPLSEEGQQTTRTEFENSAAFSDIQQYIQTLPEETKISAVEIHGTASDDNRSNIEAGIGRADEINQATARSYASIATNAIKKLLGNRGQETQFQQSAEEKMFSAEEQRALDAVRQDAGLATNNDLMTAYNDVTLALDGQSREVLDTLISERRGVEITLRTTTPAQTIVETSAAPATEETLYNQPTPNSASLFAGQLATLPAWSRIRKISGTPKKQADEDPYKKSLGERVKWHAAVAADELRDNWWDSKEDMRIIGNGLLRTSRQMLAEASGLVSDTYKTRVLQDPATQTKKHSTEYYGPAHTGYVQDATSTLKTQFEYVKTTTPDKIHRLKRRSSDLLHDFRESTRNSLDNARKRQADLNRFAKIPPSDLQSRDVNDFHAKHGVFAGEYHDVLHAKGTSLRARRLLLTFLKK